MTDHPGNGPSHGLTGRPQLIADARRHQRRRRGICGGVLIAMLGIGGLVVGFSLGGANEQGRTSGTSVTMTPRNALPAQNQSSPSTTEMSSPHTAGSVLASGRAVAALRAAERAAASLQAAQNAADAAASIRNGAPQGVVQGQQASHTAAAEAQAAAAAAAAGAAQSEHR